VTLPSFIFGSIFALLIGSIFHLLFGGNIKKLVLYLILSWIGFWIGNYLAFQLKWQLLVMGTLNLGFSILGALLLLSLGFWLSMEDSSIDSPNK